jgi:hypothetical protein
MQCLRIPHQVGNRLWIWIHLTPLGFVPPVVARFAPVDRTEALSHASLDDARYTQTDRYDLILIAFASPESFPPPLSTWSRRNHGNGRGTKI